MDEEQVILISRITMESFWFSENWTNPLVNAWEDGDEVVLITCRLQDTDSMSVAYWIENPFDFKSELYEMRFNMSNGLASQKNFPYLL